MSLRMYSFYKRLLRFSNCFLFNGEQLPGLQAEGTNKGVEVPFQEHFQYTLQRGDIAHEQAQKVLPYFESAHPCQHMSEVKERQALRGSSR